MRRQLPEDPVELDPVDPEPDVEPLPEDPDVEPGVELRVPGVVSPVEEVFAAEIKAI